jgi:AcrR family transcriptional regulator
MGRKGIKNIEGKIIAEVMREAFKNGIAAVSTKEVAAKLHISEPVIFAHFQTKQNLMTKTFETAWNSWPHTVAFPLNLTEEDDAEAYNKYKEKVQTCTAQPIPFIYTYEFINSRYYKYSDVQRVEGHFREEIVEIFHTINPKMPPKDLDLLAERFIESSITSISHIILGHHPSDDETMSMFWGARIYGFVGVLKMKGAAAPKAILEKY